MGHYNNPKGNGGQGCRKRCVPLSVWILYIMLWYKKPPDICNLRATKLSFFLMLHAIGPMNFCFIFHSKTHVDGSAAILTVLVTEAEGQRDPEDLSQANK